jgi:hypothetical protein
MYNALRLTPLSWPILLKLTVNLQKGKKRTPIILFFFKMKNNKDVHD